MAILGRPGGARGRLGTGVGRSADAHRHSASINRSGNPSRDLRTAINRLGYNGAQCRHDFSMNQMRTSSKLQAWRPHLNRLW